LRTVKKALDDVTEHAEVPVRGSRKTFCRRVVPQLGLTAGLLFFAVISPIVEHAGAEPQPSAPAQPFAAVEVTPPRGMPQASRELHRALVAKTTTKLDLAAILPAEFGDWEEPLR
jgi:hypothetical protein